MIQGIYSITNIKNNKKYYGSSKNIEKRLADHKRQLINNTHHNILLSRAVLKYGIESFIFEPVEITNFDELSNLLLLEQTYIDSNINGYNIAPANGGDIISNHPEKQIIIDKISAGVRAAVDSLSDDERKLKYGRRGAKNGMYGKTHTLETKKFLSELNTGNTYASGVKRSDEFKKAISERMKGKMVGELNPFYGKTHSAETKAILSEYQKQHNWTKGKSAEEIPYTKQYELTYPDGSSIIVYGLKELATYFKCSIANVKNTIDRMNKGSLPSKRSVFYNHLIKIMD